MRWLSLVLAACLAGPALAGGPAPAVAFDLPPPKPGHSYPECYCRDSAGARVEVGETACLTIGRRQVTSRCEKARNLTIWRHQSEGCAPGV